MNMPKEMKIRERKTNKEEIQQKEHQQKNNKLNQNKKGITLIALVITIIVLLILAGVVIATLTGDNGITTKVNEAKEQQEETEELEKLKLAVNAAYTKSQGENRILITSDIEEELEKNNLNGTLTGNEIWKYVGNKHTYTIKNNGEIKICNGTIIYGNNVNVLPEGYNQIEYLKSTGTQYIDTGVNLESNNFDIEITFARNADSSSEQAIVSTWTSDYNYWNFFIRKDTQNNFNALTVYTNGHNTLDLTTQIGEKYKAHLSRKENNWSLNVNDKKMNWQYVPTTSNPTTLKIFRRGDIPSQSESDSHISIYDFKLIINDQIRMKLYPCTKDSEYGMYDSIGNKFYQNKGTGEFLYGKNIYNCVGDETIENKYEIPLTLETTEGEKKITITLNEPLRKLNDAVDYLDLENKKVVRYIQQNATTGEVSTSENPIEENVEMEDIDFSKVISIQVNTEIEPSLID